MTARRIAELQAEIEDGLRGFLGEDGDTVRERASIALEKITRESVNAPVALGGLSVIVDGTVLRTCVEKAMQSTWGPIFQRAWAYAYGVPVDHVNVEFNDRGEPQGRIKMPPVITVELLLTRSAE